MLTSPIIFIPESITKTRATPCQVTLHFVSSVILTESTQQRVEHRNRKTLFRSWSVCCMALSLHVCLCVMWRVWCVAMGVWVEKTEPLWVRLIIDRASFRSPTYCAAKEEERGGEDNLCFWDNTPKEVMKNTSFWYKRDYLLQEKSDNSSII